MKFSRATRILHLLIIIVVSLQLLSQSFMFVPSPDKLPQTQLEAWLFVVHLCVGIMGLCFVAVRLMSVMDDEVDSKRLYPFFHQEALSQFIGELKAIPNWFKQGPPARDQDSLIASSVHGLGLLLILGLGTTGILFYIGLEPNGAMDALTKFFRETHEFFALLLWIYILGHVGMYIHHRMQGHKQVSDIFSFKDDAEDGIH